MSIFDTRISIAAIVLIELNYGVAPRVLFPPPFIAPSSGLVSHPLAIAMRPLEAYGCMTPCGRQSV